MILLPQLSTFLDKPASDAPAQAQQAATTPEPEATAEGGLWEFQPDDAYAGMTPDMDDLQPESEPVLSFMRDESLRTGSLTLALADDAEDAGESEYAASVEQQDPTYNFAVDDVQGGGMGEPAATWEATQSDDAYADSAEVVQAWDADRQPQPEQTLTYNEPHTASVTSNPYPYQPMGLQPHNRRLTSRNRNLSLSNHRLASRNLSRRFAVAKVPARRSQPGSQHQS